MEHKHEGPVNLEEQKCSCCGSNNIELITRVTGYFSKVGGWNKGKLAELKDRRNAIEFNKSEVPKTEFC